MDPVTKQQLAELINDTTLGNKVCADCNAQNPQWCSLSFAVFICLSCAGTAALTLIVATRLTIATRRIVPTSTLRPILGVHRGFGVHISFVRSVSMDSFTPEQLRRMKMGGNIPFQEFISSYEPADVGGYTSGISISEKYNCWAATQYKEKLTASLEGRTWEPSAPEVVEANISATRRSRASGRSNTRDIPSTSSFGDELDAVPDRKAANESFFESLGAANASRPADLPPSQGGRYAGFGSTPAQDSASSHPSWGLSSAAAPSLSDLQNDPVAAIGKGWSFFSSAVSSATKVVNASVIQPGMERVSDPNFRAGVAQYVTESSKSANAWGKSQLGVDVGSLVGNIASGATTVGRSGYASLAGGQNQGGPHQGYQHDEEDSALYADGGDDAFFDEFNHGVASNTSGASPSAFSGNSTSTKSVSTPQTKKDDWDESEWKDF